MTTVTRTNLATNPSFETASGIVTIRTNYCTNPSFESGTTGWSPDIGSPTLTADSAQAYVGTKSLKAVSTVSSADIAVQYIYTLDANTTYTLSYYVYSPDTRTSSFDLDGGGITTTITGIGAVSVLANTWTRVSGTFTTNASGGTVAVYQHNNNGPTTVGSAIWIDAVLLEASPIMGTYFDGSTAAAGDFTYVWTGTAGASTSNQTAPGVASAPSSNINANTAAPVQSSVWSVSGKALRIIPTGAGNDTAADAFGSVTTLGGFTAGQTYTVSATFYQSAPQTGSLNVSARSIMFADSVDGWSNTKYLAAPNVSGSVRLSLTFTVPTAASWAIVRLYNGASQSNGDVWWDNLLIEQSAIAGVYFDGNTAAVNSLAYQWTGTANASTSQEYYALPTVLAVPKTDAPCPRTEVTVVGLGAGTTVYNVWRTADGKRQAVRGARRRSGVDSDFVVDYEAPLNRVLTYDVEVVSGTQATQPTYPANVTVLSSTWWIQDPLVPSSAIPLHVAKQDSTAPYLAAAAVKSLEYGASVTLVPILGSTDPVALMGNRTIAGNVSFDMFTNLASVTTQLRNLIQQTPLLLVRSTGLRNDGIPALAYFSAAKPVEQPVTVAFGGTLTTWKLTGDLVAAPTMNVLVPIWTYGNVAALWTTYQQAQTTLAAKTYLDVLKSPSGV